MLLYDKKDNDVIIYRAEPKRPNIRQFKIDELKKRTGNNLFSTLKTNHYKTVELFNNSVNERLGSFEYSSGDSGYYSDIYSEDVDFNANKKNLSISSEELRKWITLKNYINGKYADVLPKLLSCGGSDRYFLQTKEEEYCDSAFEIRRIINLPHSLYLLQLLESGNFDITLSDNNMELVDLFNVSLFMKMSYRQIDTLSNEGVLNRDAIKKGHEISGPILSYIKKH